MYPVRNHPVGPTRPKGILISKGDFEIATRQAWNLTSTLRESTGLGRKSIRTVTDAFCVADLDGAGRNGVRIDGMSNPTTFRTFCFLTSML
jgi:hypothetical protein